MALYNVGVYGGGGGSRTEAREAKLGLTGQAADALKNLPPAFGKVGQASIIAYKENNPEDEKLPPLPVVGSIDEKQ